MARQETGGVIAGRVGRRRPMALEAVAADVAARTTRCAGSREGGMAIREVGTVGRRCSMRRERGGARIGRERRDHPGRRPAGMALIAKLLSVTGCAVRRQSAARDRTVTIPSRPTRIVVRWWHRETGHITQICTAPSHQGRGLGYELLRQSLSGLRKAGCHSATLTVTSANREAVSLYERVGFKTIRGFQAFVWEGF